MIVLPPAFDASKKYPMLVLIHGGAASNNRIRSDCAEYHPLAAPGYVILMTDYTGSTGFGENLRNPSLRPAANARRGDQSGR